MASEKTSTLYELAEGAIYCTDCTDEETCLCHLETDRELLEISELSKHKFPTITY